MGCVFTKSHHLGTDSKKYSLFKDRFDTYEQLEQALRDAGLESSNLIVGIDFTKSNSWQGGEPYYPNSNLHSKNPSPNLYQKVLSIMCNTLKPFDDDNMIPVYGFGDSRTKDKSVFSLVVDSTNQDVPAYGLENVLYFYSKAIDLVEAKAITLSGPTSFVPIIRKAIDIVKETKSYHILLIICDGAVIDIEETKNMIVEASYYPLSIVCIGVGKGPFEIMETFDDNISGRRFDNFQFVNFYEKMRECENEDVEFAKHVMMEIPDQYAYIKKFYFA